MIGELLVLATIGGRRTAFHAAQIQSVIEPAECVPIPGAPAHITGLTALRSQAMTVIDANLALQLTDVDPPAERQAIVTEVDGHSYAILVDGVANVAPGQSEITPMPGTYGGGWERVSLGMVETEQGPSLLVDIAALVAGPSRQAA